MSGIEMIPETELLAQLAEECAELAQAALKLRRALDTTNPTPVPEDECREHLCEEIADVLLCISLTPGATDDAVAYYQTLKERRWRERLGVRG